MSWGHPKQRKNVYVKWNACVIMNIVLDAMSENIVTL